MSTSTVPVKTAAEAALARADQPPDEPSDEELVIRARFVSSIRSGPKAEISGVYYCGQFMSLEAALAAEKVDFLARAREALRKRREAEEQARAAALERQRQKAVFEADAAEARAQARLAEALTIYQHTLGELAEVNAQIDATRKEHTRASHDNRVPVDRLAADLGKLSDLIGALQIRASQLDETAKHQLELLRECYRTAKAEFVFLHQKEREVHLKRPCADSKNISFSRRVGSTISLNEQRTCSTWILPAAIPVIVILGRMRPSRSGRFPLTS